MYIKLYEIHYMHAEMYSSTEALLLFITFQ
jgi:hypothetical protein